MKLRLIIMILLGLLLSNFCLASEDVTQVSRYLTIKNKPKPEQINLMSQIVQIRFPQNVQTIESAMNYLLRFSGYSLIPNKRMNEALQLTLTKPLPTIDRELGPMSLRSALSILVGQGFNLVCDPINREVDFQLKPAYRKYLKRGKA